MARNELAFGERFEPPDGYPVLADFGRRDGGEAPSLRRTKPQCIGQHSQSMTNRGLGGTRTIAEASSRRVWSESALKRWNGHYPRVRERSRAIWNTSSPEHNRPLRQPNARPNVLFSRSFEAPQPEGAVTWYPAPASPRVICSAYHCGQSGSAFPSSFSCIPCAVAAPRHLSMPDAICNDNSR